MLLKLSLKQINSDYSSKLAKEFKNYEESLENPRYLMESSMANFIDIDQFQIQENQNLNVGIIKDIDQKRELLLTNMTLFKCIKAGKILEEFAVSKDLIIKTKELINDKTKKTHYYIYLKDLGEIIVMHRRIYVLKKDIKALENLKELK